MEKLESMPLEKALRAAEKIRDILLTEGFCTRAEIAGSIRRGRPEVHDIDLVVMGCIPERLHKRLARTCTLEKQGEKNIIARLANGFQLDVFIAHEAEPRLLDPIPSNWGSVMVCRTGSTEHNIHLATVAKALGLAWDIHRGIIDVTGYRPKKVGDKTVQVPMGPIIASETEEEIFEALGLPYLTPEQRER